jgi:hypothetical protein
MAHRRFGEIGYANHLVPDAIGCKPAPEGRWSDATHIFSVSSRMNRIGN